MSEYSFGFPVEPYPQQLELMKVINDGLDKARSSGKPTLLLLESPTGTGKTMSLICSILHWIDKSREMNLTNDSDELDWVREFEHKEKLQRNVEQKLRADRWKEGSDYSSDDLDFDESGYDDVEGDRVRLIYTSRTHSQISQFVREIKRTKYAGMFKCISLGSRANMCLNENVRNSSFVNEKCMDLMLDADNTKDSKRSRNSYQLKPKKMLSSNCPYMKHKSLNKFVDLATEEVRDIEDLVHLGGKLSMCAYYASRAAIGQSDIVTLPYPSLVHSKTRSSLGIPLKGSIVVVDEAHNIIDSISEANSCKLEYEDLRNLSEILFTYFEKNENRFKHSNAIQIKRLCDISERILCFCQLKNSEKKTENEVVTSNLHEIITVNEFLIASRIECFNLFEILDFVEIQQIPKRIRAIQTSIGERCSASIQRFIEFLNALNYSNNDGRILLEKSRANSRIVSMRFLMLNSAISFEEIFSEALCVILIGGTMSPFELYQTQLLSCHENTNIVEFACDHVIPKENVLSRVMTNGPSGNRFLFDFASRSNPEQLDEVGRCLMNISNIIPGGIICFFCSYDMLNEAQNQWNRSQIISKIQQKKFILFDDTKSKSSKTEDILTSFKTLIAKDSTKGAILVSVVGGRLSEGINFSDDLARCIVVVGMPYANRANPELAEKLKFTSSNDAPAGSDSVKSVKSGSYYQNLCMRAVNQTIGRAIRHKNDYASIILLDHRYSNGQVLDLLPGWLNTKVSTSFASCFKDIREFFKTRQRINKCNN